MPPIVARICCCVDGAPRITHINLALMLDVEPADVLAVVRGALCERDSSDVLHRDGVPWLTIAQALNVIAAVLPSSCRPFAARRVRRAFRSCAPLADERPTLSRCPTGQEVAEAPEKAPDTQRVPRVRLQTSL